MTPVETTVPLSSINLVSEGKGTFLSFGGSSSCGKCWFFRLPLCSKYRWKGLTHPSLPLPLLCWKEGLIQWSVWKFRSRIKQSKASFLDVFLKPFKPWYKITNTSYVTFCYIGVYMYMVYIYIHICRIMAKTEAKFHETWLALTLCIPSNFCSILIYFYFIKKKKKTC